MAGWICLHRKLLEWEWYGDINAKTLFIHCLLRANHKPKKWRGILIGRGQFWTSLDSLSNEIGLSSKQIRTALTKLESTGEVASKGQARGRMITVLNYDSYQEEGKLEGRQKAGKGQAEGRLGATNNNDNNENNETSNTKLPVPPVDETATPPAVAPKKSTKPKVDFSVFGMSDHQIDEVKRIRRQNKGGPITQRVANALSKEFHKAATEHGYTFDELLTEWELRNWKAFKAEWIKPRTGQFNQQSMSKGDLAMAGTLKTLQNMDMSWLDEVDQ